MSKKPKNEYRLPDGTITTSMRLFLKEWRAISAKLKELLDLDVIGFDPGFLCGDAKGNASVDLPMWLVRRIINLQKPAEES